MGDSFPVLFRFGFPAGQPVRREAAQFFGCAIDEAELDVGEAPDPIEAIEFRIEQQGPTRKDLEGILGTRTRVSEVLNRRRGLSIHMIRHLHEKLGIRAEVLIRATRGSEAA